MDEMTVKRFVAQKLQEGIALPEIQKLLVSELDCRMTFLDLRLLAAELEDVDWKQFDPAEPKKEEEKSGEGAGETVPAGAGATKVEISRLARPGAYIHGTVQFASGASAEWLIDQMGQLGLDKVNGEPTEEDFADFQKELKNLLSRR